MATNPCGAAVEEEAQSPGLPRCLIFQLQLVPALPQEQRVELFPVAIARALARPPPGAAVKSSPQTAPQVLLEAASESFPALALLFLCWLLSQSFCLSTRPFSFAIFSSHLLVLALDWKIFSISSEGQLNQAFPLALASPPLHHQFLSAASFCCDLATLLPLAMLPSPSLLTLPTYRLRCSTLLSPASLSESDSVISWVSGKFSVFSSICLRPLLPWHRASVISSGSGLERRASRVGSFRIRRSIFLPRC